MKRVQPSADSTIDGESSGRRSAETLRYEEVALAFDDDPPDDGPTIEAHALPSDPAILAAMPLAEEEPSPTPSQVAPAAKIVAETSPAPRGVVVPAPARRRAVVWVAALTAIVAAFVAAAWLAALVR